jgi:hypothetical protein
MRNSYFNPASILILFGSICGVVGIFFHVNWLFLIGVVICTLNYLMNILSGVAKPTGTSEILIIIPAFVFTPWYFGLGVGIVVVTLWELTKIVSRIIFARILMRRS